MGGCNCKGKKQVINNLHIPSYVQLAKDYLESIKDIPVEQLDDHQLGEGYHIYNSIFPNSNGQPSKEELIKIITNAASYKTRINGRK